MSCTVCGEEIKGKAVLAILGDKDRKWGYGDHESAPFELHPKCFKDNCEVEVAEWVPDTDPPELRHFTVVRYIEWTE